MQEAIYQIGKAVFSKDNVVESLIRKLETIKNKKQQHVVKLNFNTKENKLIIDGKEEVMEDTAYKYLYVDKIGGPTAPQYLVSRNTNIYHLTETIPFLIEHINDDKIKNKLEHILEVFFIDRGEEITTKYRYALNLKKFNITDEEIESELRAISQKNKKVNDAGKEVGKYLSKLLNEYIKNQLSLSSKEVSLYTILIDDVPIAKENSYREMVINKKLGINGDNTKKQSKKNRNLCMLCNEPIDEFGDLTKFKLKFFTTNLVGFASGLDKKAYFKNMSICNDCMNKIQAGETYAINNLNARLFGFSIYLIPHFIIGEPLEKEELDLISENIVKSFNSIKSYRGIETLEDDIDAFIDYKDSKSYYHLNILFYKRVNAATKVKRLIKDINPSIFLEINKNINYTYKSFKNVLGENYRQKISLESIYYLTPIRLDNKNEPQQYNQLLDIYDCIFSKRNIRKSMIIDNILKSIRIIMFNKQSYNIAPDKTSIQRKILEGNALIKFLEYMGCIKEEDIVSELELKLPEDIINFISEMKFNEQQTGLFLLGNMIGEIGNCQYKRTKDNKPILNKLNFSGIDKAKLIRLVNEVYSKLVQEKILKYNEILFHSCKKIIDKNLGDWKLSKSENLYYILSGYGYATTKPMLKEKKEDNNNEIK